MPRNILAKVVQVLRQYFYFFLSCFAGAFSSNSYSHSFPGGEV